LLTEKGKSILSQLDATWQELSYAINTSKKVADNDTNDQININK